MSTTTLPAGGSHDISLQTAIDMTTLYRTNRETILATAYKNQDILPLSETFNRQDIDNLLAVEGCEGLRIYNGMDENNKVHAILVPVNNSNEDILTPALLEDDEPVIIELGQRCPPSCPPASDLNS